MKYGYNKPTHPQLTPHNHRDIKYGATHQLRPAEDTISAINAVGIKIIQAIIGALLYYAQAADNKLLVLLSVIGSQKSATTEDTATAIIQLLDYVATYQNDDIIYLSIKMVLADHADAGFHNKSKGRSRAGAHIFLSDNKPGPRWNGPVLTIVQIIKFVMTSAAKAELG